jgi:hypothetical protein
MIVRRGRIRHEHGRQAHRGQFREGRSAGAADCQRRCAQGQFHFGEERVNDGFNAERRGRLPDIFGVVRSGQVQQLQLRRGGSQQRQRFPDEFIDAARALAAAHDEQNRPRGIEAERRSAHGGIARLELRGTGVPVNVTLRWRASAV